MTKSELAKKTAKLMVDKLSPTELENELYQLLIMLSTNNVEYVRDDIEKGNVAGIPVEILSMGTQDYDLSRSDSMYEDEDEDEDDRHPVDELQGSDDRDDEDYEVVYRFEVTKEDEEGTLDKISTTDFANEFFVNDDIYIYDEYNDRWIQHEITEVILKDGNHTEFIVEPIGGFGPTAILYPPFTDKQVVRKSESQSPITGYMYGYEWQDKDDNTHKDEFVAKIESHPEVDIAYISDMTGVIDIHFNTFDGDVVVNATPSWEEDDEIPIQVYDVKADDVIEPGDNSDVIYMRDDVDFITEQGVYPSRKNFYQKYYDKIDDIYQIATNIYKDDYNKKYYADKNK